MVSNIGTRRQSRVGWIDVMGRGLLVGFVIRVVFWASLFMLLSSLLLV